MKRLAATLLCFFAIFLMSGRSAGDWVALDSLSSWRAGNGQWVETGEVKLDPGDPAKFLTTTGRGVLVNGPSGKTSDLLSADEYADVEVHVEFMVPKGSNSGVYLQGRYEVQVFDSWGVANPTYSDCGGIYQRWKEPEQQGYEGHAPRRNASKAPGEWQSFDIAFRAPHFDSAGRKTDNAKFLKVVLNGAVIHENVEVTGPTRAATFNDEQPKGPLMLQGDHGPVAYRNIRVRQAP